MSAKTTVTFVCDRCGLEEPPRALRNTEDDDGRPFEWAVITLHGKLHGTRELCAACTTSLKTWIGGKL